MIIYPFVRSRHDLTWGGELDGVWRARSVNHLSNAERQLGVRGLPQLCTGGGTDGMSTAAYASAPLKMASLRSGGSPAAPSVASQNPGLITSE